MVSLPDGFSPGWFLPWILSHLDTFSDWTDLNIHLFIPSLEITTKVQPILPPIAHRSDPNINCICPNTFPWTCENCLDVTAPNGQPMASNTSYGDGISPFPLISTMDEPLRPMNTPYVPLYTLYLQVETPYVPVNTPYVPMDVNNPGDFYTGPLDQHSPATETGFNTDHATAYNSAMQPDNSPGSLNVLNNNCFGDANAHANVTPYTHVNADAYGHVSANINTNPENNTISSRLCDRSFICTNNSCNTTFKRHQDLTRHQRCKHERLEIFFCRIPGCQRTQGFPRKDKRNDHEKTVKAHRGV